MIDYISTIAKSYDRQLEEVYYQARRDERPSIVGGGFGLDGAIKGIVTANILNGIKEGFVQGNERYISNQLKHSMQDDIDKACISKDALESYIKILESSFLGFENIILIDLFNLELIIPAEKELKKQLSEIEGVVDEEQLKEIAYSLIKKCPNNKMTYNFIIDHFKDIKDQLKIVATVFGMEEYVNNTMPSVVDNNKGIISLKSDDDITRIGEYYNSLPEKEVIDRLKFIIHYKLLIRNSEYVENSVCKYLFEYNSPILNDIVNDAFLDFDKIKKEEDAYIEEIFDDDEIKNQEDFDQKMLAATDRKKFIPLLVEKQKSFVIECMKDPYMYILYESKGILVTDKFFLFGKGPKWFVYNLNRIRYGVETRSKYRGSAWDHLDSEHVEFQISSDHGQVSCEILGEEGRIDEKFIAEVLFTINNLSVCRLENSEDRVKFLDSQNEGNKRYFSALGGIVKEYSYDKIIPEPTFNERYALYKKIINKEKPVPDVFRNEQRLCKYLGFDFDVFLHDIIRKNIKNITKKPEFNNDELNNSYAEFKGKMSAKKYITSTFYRYYLGFLFKKYLPDGIIELYLMDSTDSECKELVEKKICSEFDFVIYKSDRIVVLDRGVYFLGTTSNGGGELDSIIEFDKISALVFYDEGLKIRLKSGSECAVNIKRVDSFSTEIAIVNISMEVVDACYGTEEKHELYLETLTDDEETIRNSTLMLAEKLDCNIAAAYIINRDNRFWRSIGLELLEKQAVIDAEEKKRAEELRKKIEREEEIKREEERLVNIYKYRVLSNRPYTSDTEKLLRFRKLFRKLESKDFVSNNGEIDSNSRTYKNIIDIIPNYSARGDAVLRSSTEFKYLVTDNGFYYGDKFIPMEDIVDARYYQQVEGERGLMVVEGRNGETIKIEGRYSDREYYFTIRFGCALRIFRGCDNLFLISDKKYSHLCTRCGYTLDQDSLVNYSGKCPKCKANKERSFMWIIPNENKRKYSTAILEEIKQQNKFEPGENKHFDNIWLDELNKYLLNEEVVDYVNQMEKLAKEEAKAKAEEEARLKAEEEAMMKAEEEARLKAEEEARLKSEEEARLKAEEEARVKAEENTRAEEQKKNNLIQFNLKKKNIDAFLYRIRNEEKRNVWSDLNTIMRYRNRFIAASSEINGIIAKYDFDDSIIMKMREIIPLYKSRGDIVLFISSKESFAVTDTKLYLNGDVFDLSQVTDIICFDSHKGCVVRTIDRDCYYDISYDDEFVSVVTAVSVSNFSIVTPKTPYLINSDKDQYWCCNCSSFIKKLNKKDGSCPKCNQTRYLVSSAQPRVERVKKCLNDFDRKYKENVKKSADFDKKWKEFMSTSIKEARNHMVCPRCKKIMTEYARFCSGCGAEFK
ncbi:MAG: hypothetical protein IJ743_03270 [Bacilli bacterium]|nr:hypothetical protein [Bacilli bacterium]